MTQNSSNQDYTPNADGFSIGGGIIKRILNLISGNATITGGGSSVVVFPTENATLAYANSNGNVIAQNIIGNYATTATAAGTTTLTVSSKLYQFFTGSNTQTVVLPDATTLTVGTQYYIDNNSTGSITVNKNGGAQLAVVPANSDMFFIVTDVSSAAGVWDCNLKNNLIQSSSTSAQAATFATDIYLAGSFIVFPFTPQVGTTYKLIFDVTKSAAGTATPILTIRTGTAGSTADTSRCAFTFGAGTAAADTGLFEAIVVFRSVGGTTSAVIQGITRLTSNLTTTGLSNAKKAIPVTSGGFDSTTASLGIGASYNGGTSASHTVQLVHAELVM